MSRIIRLLGYVVVAVLAVAFLGAAGLWVNGGRTLARRYPAEFPAVSPKSDSASIARGAHLAKAVLNCSVCHGPDLGGAVYMDAGPMGVVARANLTTGKGGIGATRTDADLVRAIRYGIRKDSTSLVLMPSEVFVHLTDEDMGAVLGYIRQLPPVDREVPASRFGPLGRLMLGAGKFNILPASKTDHLTPVASIVPDQRQPTGSTWLTSPDVTGVTGTACQVDAWRGRPTFPPRRTSRRPASGHGVRRISSRPSAPASVATAAPSIRSCPSRHSHR